jgi:orotate phosphoribosyltransferase
MRWDVLAIWLLPAFCEDLTAAARSSDDLTTAGQNIITAFVWLIIVGLWVLAVASFARRESKAAKAAVISNGILANLNGDEYLMVPADLSMQEEVRKENRRSRQIERLKQSAE